MHGCIRQHLLGEVGAEEMSESACGCDPACKIMASHKEKRDPDDYDARINKGVIKSGVHPNIVKTGVEVTLKLSKVRRTQQELRQLLLFQRR